MPVFSPHETPPAQDQPASKISAPSSAAAGVLLHVDTPIANQRVVAGLPLRVTGWVLSRWGLHQLSVALGSQVKTAQTGLYRADLKRTFPSHAQIFHAGFQCLLDPFLDRGGETVLTLTAEAKDGQIHKIDVPIFIDTEADQTVHAVLEATQPGAGEPLRLTIEQAAVDRTGLLRIAGWALGLTRIEAIEVRVDGQSIGQADYGQERKDIAAAWPLYPRCLTSGFIFLADAKAFPDEFALTIKAQAIGGVEREVTLPIQQRKRAPRREPGEMQRLECDMATLSANGDLAISGWALASAGIDRIRVFLRDELLGDELLGEAGYGLDRPDVGNQFPTLMRSHQAGFRFTAKVDPSQLQSELVFELETVLKDATSRRYPVAIAVQASRASAAAGVPDPLFVLDEPRVIDGRVKDILQNGLLINGWAVARDGIDRIVVELDGIEAGTAYYGIRREDVAHAYPAWPNALLSGFTLSLPRRVFTAGHHSVTVRAIGKSSAERAITFGIEVGFGQEEYGPWALRRAIPAAERLLSETKLARLKSPPRFLIWLRCESAEPNELHRTLHTLENQLYRNWRVVLSGLGPRSALKKMIDSDFAGLRAQIHLAGKFKTKKADEADWVVTASAGDEFGVDALSEMAFAIEMNEGCDFIYADERRLNLASHQIEAFFKPDWSPHLLMSANYIGRPWAVPRKSLHLAGHELSSFDTFCDYDLILEFTETAKRCVHVPSVLYARDGDGFDRARDSKALKRMAKRRRLAGAIKPGRVEGSYRLHRKLKADKLVSIIIPTCGARGLIKTCIESLKSLSTYSNIEIIIVDNILDQDSPWKAWLRTNADAVVEVSEPFNWSRFNNLAAQEANGSYLLFLNDDIEVIQPDWLEAMLEDASLPEAGVVGPQLLYPDGKVQHAGVFLTAPGKARHAFRFCDADDPGYFGLALTRRDVIGVTGACMLMRREVYDAVGGFDEAHTVINNDLDFCLKTRAKGLWNIYTPFAQLIHHELASRATLKDVYDETAFERRWSSTFHSGDPFFNPHLSRAHDAYRYDTEPTRFVFPGRPYYLKRDLKRVLAIKVDHIGDFLTALRAFRRIKEHFPQVWLSVLAAPASLQLADLEPAIDEMIPFDFFHARSELGQKEIGEAELDALKAKLAPYKFDLAIDLRKHPDTRKLLLYTGATVTAGFEGGHAFPWLDIARPFEGDERLAAKHAHVADDLSSLVDQVAAAGDMDRGTIYKDRAFKTKTGQVKTKYAEKGLFTRQVVCVHPAAGSDMKQWPPSYFADLIDRLIEAEDVNVAIIGSPDEIGIAESLLAAVTRQERVRSLTGRLKLAELPYFLASCALFIGNDSGPKHIAAGVGTPVLGIHSGIVDSNEWGPLGETSLAIKRDMTCAPCYLVKPEDCHRGLACLTDLSPGIAFQACQRLLHYGRG